MADLDLPQSNETERDARDGLVLEASWQIEALSDIVLEELVKLDAEGISGIKSSIIRIRQLSGATMSAIGDDSMHLDNVHHVVHGTRMAREMQHA